MSIGCYVGLLATLCSELLVGALLATLRSPRPRTDANHLVFLVKKT